MTRGSSAVRIVVVDDHPIFRDGLRRILALDRRFRVCGEAGNAVEGLDLVLKHQPDVLLLDVAMPGPSGLDVLRDVLRASRDTKPIVLTAGLNRGQFLQALKFGARGVVLKESATDVLFKAILAVARGEYWIYEESAEHIGECYRIAGQARPVNTLDYGLTPREQDILGMLIRGASNREIATHFGVAEETVKHHVSSMLQKCNVSSRMELAMFAINHGLLTDDVNGRMNRRSEPQ
jgi:two-component system, NarL family, nitrate/nitrite response regulator NarL